MKTKAEFREMVMGTHSGDENTKKTQLCEAYDDLYDNTLKKGGTGTAAQIAALENVTDGAVYRCITTGGAVNSGAAEITLAVRDIVYWDAATELWVLLADADA